MSAWDEPGCDPLADLQAALELVRQQPYQPYVPLISERCHAPGRHNCRSAICECVCHLTPLPMTDEDWADTES